MLITFFLNTFFIFIFGYIYFLSTIGYGIIFNKILFDRLSLPFSINIFFGFIFLFLIQYIIYIFFKISEITNFLILSFGLFITLKFFIKKKFILNYSLVYIFLFTSFIVIKPHDDFHHHISSVFTYFNQELTFGLYNLDPVFGYQPLTVFLQSLTMIKPLYENFFYTFNFIIYISFIIFLYEILNERKIHDICKFIIVIILLFFLIKFNRLSEHGNDLPGQIFLLMFFIIFYLIDTKYLNFDYLIIGTLFFILSISIKTSNIILFPMYLFIFFQYFRNIKASKKMILKYFVLCTFFLGVVLFNNFQKSGCLVPLITFSCLDFTWGANIEDVKNFLVYSELDTKGFYNFEKHNFKDPNLYLKFYNWFPVWIKTHFFYKVFEFTLVFFLIFLLCLFLTSFTNTTKNYNNKNSIFLIFTSFISMLIWLNLFPQVRYFSGGIIIFLILVSSYFIKLQFKLNYKRINFFLIFIILLVNIKNFNRIINEHKKYENYKIDLPKIHYPIKKLSIIDNYEILCRTDYQCEYKKNLVLKKKDFFNILYLNH